LTAGATGVVVAVAIATADAAAAAGAQPVRCAGERWSVQTVTDPRSSKIKLQPQETTIAALRRLHAPRSLSTRVRIRGVETTIYRLTAALVAMKLARDGDINVVLADAAGRTMLAEFPDPRCTRHATPGVRRMMASGRRALVSACGQATTSSWKPLHGQATLEGVGLFDVPSIHRGIPLNGIELHPVFAFSAASC
jgi:hypothetical protein